MKTPPLCPNYPTDFFNKNTGNCENEIEGEIVDEEQALLDGEEMFLEEINNIIHLNGLDEMSLEYNSVVAMVDIDSMS